MNKIPIEIIVLYDAQLVQKKTQNISASIINNDLGIIWIFAKKIKYASQQFSAINQSVR